MSASSANPSWVDAKDNAGEILVQYAHALESRLETRLTNWELYAAMYSEQLETSLRPSRQRWLAQPSGTRNSNLTFNMARSLVETEHATITEAMPRPTFLTEDGNRPQQDKAKELQFAIDGLFSDLRVYETIERSELDKCVLGTGCIKVHVVNGRPAVDRVLASEILVDEDLMGAGRDPLQIIHRQEVPRATMLAQCKELGSAVLNAITDAPALLASGVAGHRADLIAVYDAYSLPIDDETPGRHAIAIENYTELLFDEEWKTPRLPFVFQRWQRPTTGFYGIGIIEQVLGIQVEINKFFRNVSRSLTRWGVVTTLIPTLAKVDTLKWTNSPDGKFMEYDSTGGQPTFLNGPVLTPEVMAWLQFQIDIGYQVTGISQNTAFSQREAGIPSARGQREISQKGASRLAPQSKQYERTYVDTAWALDDVLRRLKEEGTQLVISTVDQGALHRVDLDEALSLTPGSYHIDVFAGNFLSRHPASKFEQVQEMANTGMFSKPELRALTQMPDITAALGKPIDIPGIFKKQIDKAVKKGIYSRPESFWPLDQGVPLYRDALFEAQADGVADSKLQLLRDWLVAAKDIMQPPDAPPAPTGAEPLAPDATQAPAPLPQDTQGVPQ